MINDFLFSLYQRAEMSSSKLLSTFLLVFMTLIAGQMATPTVDENSNKEMSLLSTQVVQDSGNDLKSMKGSLDADPPLQSQDEQFGNSDEEEMALADLTSRLEKIKQDIDISMTEEIEVDFDDTELDSFGIFVANLYQEMPIVKCTTLMTHFEDYILKRIKSEVEDTRDENGPVKFKPTEEHSKYPTYIEIFGGMYTNYLIMSSMLSLKACTIYYSHLNPEVSEACSRYSSHLGSFLKTHSIADMFGKNKLRNDKINQIQPEFTAECILEKLLQTRASLHKSLDQDFTRLKRDFQETMKDRTIYKREFDVNKLLVDVPIYQPHDSLDRAYTTLWKMLLDPIKENLIIFHNYFNDAMNIVHFIESIDGFMILPKSRPFMTNAWKELARNKSLLEGNDSTHLVFRTIRSIETNRIVSTMPFDENGDVNVALPENLYTLIDIAIPRDGKPRDSDFYVAI